jgi:hypothetical protein
MHQILVLLTDATAFDIVEDPVFCPGPVEHTSDSSDGFIPSWVSYSGVVVPFGHDSSSDFVIGRNN